jgi:plastocyanin
MTTRSMRLAAARLTLCLLAIGVAAAVLLPPSYARAATLSVAVEDFDFSPATRTIEVGDVVRWTFSGSSHSVTSRDGVFDSGIKAAGSTFQFTFTKPGTYAYFCVVHPALMSGTIVVTGTSATPKPTVKPTATPRPTATPTSTPTPTPKPTPRPTARPTASPTPPPASTSSPATASPSVSPTPSRSAAPSASPSSSEAIVEPPNQSSAPTALASIPAEPANAGDSTPVIAGVVVLAVIALGGGLLLARRRRAT